MPSGVNPLIRLEYVRDIRIGGSSDEDPESVGAISLQAVNITRNDKMMIVNLSFRIVMTFNFKPLG
jgi:hypothetical protein